MPPPTCEASDQRSIQARAAGASPAHWVRCSLDLAGVIARSGPMRLPAAARGRSAVRGGSAARAFTPRLAVSGLIAELTALQPDFQLLADSHPWLYLDLP